MRNFTVEVTASFEAAHQLEGDVGKCAKLHGHRWRVCAGWATDTAELSSEGFAVWPDGVALNLSHLKKALREVCEHFDHTFLNDVIKRPTAERLAVRISEMLARTSRSPDYVVVEETDGCSVTYKV